MCANWAIRRHSPPAPRPRVASAGTCVGPLDLLVVSDPDLRQMRYFVKVAELGSFTAAAAELHVAQQAVSQQVRAIEQMLDVVLLRRGPRAVTPTAAGEVFLRESKRVIEAAERTFDRTRAASRGDAGTLRIAYTLTSAYETFPELQAALRRTVPGLDVVSREVFGGDVPALLSNGAFDVALAPRWPLPDGLASQSLRQEPFVVAVSENHRIADSEGIELAALEDEPIELWPRHMAPGFYDAVVAACRGAGFEPSLDRNAAGSVVWRPIAEGRGVGLVVGSLERQLPRGVRLVPLRPPQPVPLHVDLIWLDDPVDPALERFCELAAEIAMTEGWLRPHASA
jgi:DNA-binding transcriptional LysR family regulator